MHIAGCGIEPIDLLRQCAEELVASDDAASVRLLTVLTVILCQCPQLDVTQAESLIECFASGTELEESTVASLVPSDLLQVIDNCHRVFGVATCRLLDWWKVCPQLAFLTYKQKLQACQGRIPNQTGALKLQVCTAISLC